MILAGFKFAIGVALAIWVMFMSYVAVKATWYFIEDRIRMRGTRPPKKKHQRPSDGFPLVG